MALPKTASAKAKPTGGVIKVPKPVLEVRAALQKAGIDTEKANVDEILEGSKVSTKRP